MLAILLEEFGNVERSIVAAGHAGVFDAGAELHRRAGEQARAAAVQRLYAVGDLSRYAVQAYGEGGRHFTDVDTLAQTLSADLDPSCTVLVKGSRAMGMERIVRRLVEEN